jgi:hypothetical protein
MTCLYGIFGNHRPGRRPPPGRSPPERHAPPATRSGHHPARPAAAHQRRASSGPTPAGHHHPAEPGAGRQTPPMRPAGDPTAIRPFPPSATGQRAARSPYPAPLAWPRHRPRGEPEITGEHPAQRPTDVALKPPEVRLPGDDRSAGTSLATPDGGYMRTCRGPRRHRPQRADVGPGNAWSGRSGGQGSAARPCVRGDRRLAGTCLMRAADPEPPPACSPARQMPRWHIDTVAGKRTAIPAPALSGQQDPWTGPGVKAGRPSTPARAGRAADHRR